MEYKRRPSEILKELLDRAVVERAAGEDRDYTYIHPSTMGKCVRSIAYDMLKADEPKSTLEPRILRIFSNGHHVHSRVEEELEIAGVLIKNEVQLGSKLYNMGGHTDDLVKIEMDDGSGMMCLIEIKSANDKSFRYQRSMGIDEKHLDQLHVYMFLTGIHHGIIIIENKNDQDREYIDVYYDQERVDRLLGKANAINMCGTNNRVPARPEDMTKSCFQCKYCNYKDECWEGPATEFEYMKAE